MMVMLEPTRPIIAPTNVTERGSYLAWSDDDGATWRTKKLPGAQPHEKPEYAHETPTLGYTARKPTSPTRPRPAK